MRTGAITAAAAAIGAAGLVGIGAAPASAQLSPQGTGHCRLGTTVATRDGRTGTVDKAEGNSCWVKFPDGKSDYFQQWMLKPARSGGARGGASSGGASSGGAAGGGGRAPDGSYQCYGGQAGNMRITIRGGRWNEFYAQAIPGGKVGISSRPDGKPYYMVCERR
jgi:hypothetical protein